MSLIRFNSLLHGIFDQRILLGGEGGQKTPNLTPKSKVMKTPNLGIRIGVHQNWF